MRDIREIIIHCADTPNGKIFHASDIDRWHKERGWTKIGYHWVIGIDGFVEAGRHPDEGGAHAEGHNLYSLGICLIGTNKFTQLQWNTLKLLVSRLKSEYTNAVVIGHYQVAKNGKTCPNFDVPDWLAHDMTPNQKNILEII